MRTLFRKTLVPAYGLARQALTIGALLLIGLVDGQVVQTFNASGTYTVPAGVTRVVVECYGGGGRGGSRSSNGQGGGGGGGAYARSILTVVPGSDHTVTVGAGSSSGTSPGGDSWFSTATTVMAKGGASVPNNNSTGATGGSAAASIGTVKFNGGNGGGVGSSTGGGGGASGGYGGPGGNGAVGVGGTAPPGGGAGGAGGILGAAGTAGTAPGGGGGGAAKWFLSGAAAGGNGATGRVVVSYYTPGSCMTTTTGINGIADNQCAANAHTSVPMVISGQPTILGTAPGNARLVSVGLIISHTYNSDMDITLTSPAGTTRNMVLDRYGSGDNLGNPATCPSAIFTLQDGGTPLSNLNTSNVTGTFAPEESLAGFTGDPNGMWTLNVCDDAGGDLGVIRYFQLEFCTVPEITATSSNSPICAGSSLTLDATATGSPAPTYSWTGTGTFSPDNTSPNVTVAGAATGTYTVTASSSCGSATANIPVVVNPLPTVTCPPNSNTCIDAPAYTLVGTGESPSGGTFSGPGVSGNSFDPAVAGLGSHTITYSYTDGNGCSNTCTCTITVNALPVVTCPANSSVCVDAPAYALAGSGESPAGGTFSGTGVSGNSFDPAVAGAGAHTITYCYTDGNGCDDCCNFTITVNALPVVTCPLNSSACINASAFSLVGTGENPAGGTFSGPGVAGNSFDPAVAGVGTHSITYTYTDGNGCSDDCTYSITVDPDTDGDGVCDPQDDCPLVVGQIGSPCDDGNCYTTGDVLNGSCVCAGTPVPCDTWTLTIESGANGGEISWIIQEDGGPCVLQTGGPYANNSTNNVSVCVPTGNCFKLTMNDAGGDGIVGGGWKLVDNNGRRILDNEDNGGCFSTTSTHGLAFCNEPASAQTVIDIHCDKTNWLPTDVIIASEDPAVSAQWGIGDQTDDGYTFWFLDPCGSYNRRIFRNHATSGGHGPANALRACKLKLSSMVSYPLPQNTLLNVRVRSRVNGVDGTWGPACRFMIDVNSCTLTQLNNDISSPNYSCGVSGKVVGASGNTGKIFATVVTSGGNPATHYRFNFAVPGEGYSRNLVSTNAACLLGIWQTAPLLCGTYTYEVRVQASFDGGLTYCPFGTMCQVDITNNTAYCTAPGAMAQQPETRELAESADGFAMYPNPNREGQLFLAMNGIADNVEVVSVDIYDMLGQRATSATIAVAGGLLNTVLDLPVDMPAGMYLVNITAGDHVRSERLVVQR